MDQDARVVIAHTERLTLRRLTPADAPFILDLLNQPSFLEFIGDRGVRSLDDARAYLQNGPLASYAQHGFGLFAVEVTATGSPIGLCGLLRRDTLDDVDLGYALLPDFWGAGYALEAARAMLPYARGAHGLIRLVAITSLENPPSIRLLEKLGMRFERLIRLSDDAEEARLFGIAL